MANPMEAIMQFLMDNIFYIVIIGLVFYVIHNYFKLKRIEKIRSVDRSEVERKNVAERLKLNPSNKYKWLYHGNNCIGKISHLIDTQIQSNPEKIEVYTMVVRPLLMEKPVKITNPLAKVKIVEVEKSKQIIVWTENTNGFATESNKLKINDNVAISQYMGVYYTIGIHEKEMIANIRDFDVIKTDLNNLSSIYFVKSQEQSTYQPQYAHELALKEKEIQLMMAQKKGKMETI